MSDKKDKPIVPSADYYKSAYAVAKQALEENWETIKAHEDSRAAGGKQRSENAESQRAWRSLAFNHAIDADPTLGRDHWETRGTKKRLIATAAKIAEEDEDRMKTHFHAHYK
jgi:hypothetical protein